MLLSEISQRNHSFRSLGPEYYVDIKVENVAGSRLVLFNRELAQELHFELPDSEQELEKLILENFAWFKAARHQNGAEADSATARTLFATRYQDGDDKSEGSALGDGRAVWIGEIVNETLPGYFHYADVTLKGIGVTPLAWFKHLKENHRDGLLSMNEAVHEYIYSLAAKANRINTVGVLAVIELPFQRACDNEKAAIIVRVGNHLRFAHYRYFADNAEQLTRIFEYGLKRDMGLPLNYAVGPEDARTYLDSIVNNLARDAAVYFDVHAVHGSPTFGNRTSCGGTIDLSTFVFTDAHHSNYSYMPDGTNLLGGEWGQTEQFFNLFSILLASLKNSGFKYAADIMPVEYFFRQFKNKFEQILTRRWLTRLGLSGQEIDLLCYETKEYFFETVKSIYEATGTKKLRFKNRKILMAAFDPRKILSGTADCLEALDDITALWQVLFKVQRNWGTYKLSDARPYIKAYRTAVLRIVRELNVSAEDTDIWKRNSARIRLAERNEPGPDFFWDSEKYFVSEEILQEISSGKLSWPELSQLAQDSVAKLADHGFEPA